MDFNENEDIMFEYKINNQVIKKEKTILDIDEKKYKKQCRYYKFKKVLNKIKRFLIR